MRRERKGRWRESAEMKGVEFGRKRRRLILRDGGLKEAWGLVGKVWS